MPVSWKKVGRGIELIVLVGLVIAVAMLWKRDHTDAAAPAAVPANEPVTITREPAVGPAGTIAIDETRPVRQSLGSTPASPPASLLPTPEQYRPNYELVLSQPVTATGVDCGRFDVTTTQEADDFQNLGQQPQVILKIATDFPYQTDFVQRLLGASKSVAARTAGRVSIKIYSGGVQGTGERLLRKISIGQLQGGTFSPADLLNTYPDLSIYELPILFESEGEVRYVRERLDGYLISGLREAGFVSFGFVGSFAYLMSIQPYSVLDELSGAHTWLPQGNVIQSEWLSRNLLPVELPVTDVLTALQTGLIGSVIVSPELAIALQWHSRTRFIFDRPVFYTMSFMAIDRTALNAMRADDRDIVEHAMRRVYCELDQESGATSADAFEAMIKMGNAVRTLPDYEWEKLRQSAFEYRQVLTRSGYISGELYNEIQRLTEEYRSLAPP